MIKLLFVAYQFPPMNIGGSARPARFVKHLHKHGIETTVVTLAEKSYGKVYPSIKKDSNLFENVDPLPFKKIEVASEELIGRRKSKLHSFKAIFFNRYKGSEGKYWKTNFKTEVEQYIQNNEVDVIMVTAPPFSVLPLAAETARKFNKPLIVDMRDHWTLWGISPFGTYYNFKASKKVICR